MVALNYKPVCGCGKPLKIFSSGKVAKGCTSRKCFPSQKTIKTAICIDCWKPATRGSARCMPCSGIAKRKVVKAKHKPAVKTWKCAECGVPVWRGSKRCRQCATPPKAPSVCVGCGKEFSRKQHGSKDAMLYCSRECAFEHFKDWHAIDGEMNRVAEYKHPKMCLIYWPVCVTCGKTFLANQKTANVCSAQCSKQKYVNRKYGRDRSARACRCCGNDFTPAYGDKRSAYCSPKCLKKHAGRIGKAKRRAIERGAQADKIDPFLVFDRDGWRCQICGKSTPKARRGTCNSNAPELDHRVPLSKGGPHTYANVQCACRACNQMKGDRFDVGQLPLFNQLDTGAIAFSELRLTSTAPSTSFPKSQQLTKSQH